MKKTKKKKAKQTLPKKVPSSAYANEAEVEQKFILPLLTGPGALAIPGVLVKPKEYVPPTLLDKAAGRRSGYYPDFSIWLLGHPVLIVEAKDPNITSQTGFREASLYARHLNTRYPSGLNPCKFVVATNGVDLLAGYWDQEKPLLEVRADDLKNGTSDLDKLIELCGHTALEVHAREFLGRIGIEKGVRPFSKAGGQPLLTSKRALNTFAADLSPVLRRYFSSTNPDSIREIAERAYVSSDEITEYDRVLEAMLKDRVVARRDTIVRPIRTHKNDEPLLTRAIQEFQRTHAGSGQLQIIQGGVGSGKSLFVRRYRDLLEPEDLKQSNYWSFVDFNFSPASVKGAEDWLCESFVSGFEKENPRIDIYANETLRGIFSRKIQQHKAYYEQLRSISAEEETRARARHIAEWQSDLIALSDGISNLIMGVMNKNLIVVLDNVDKLDLQNQLDAFQLALWFMGRTRAFVILQMRDETYERYKNRPPLDTYRTGIAFHIAPPRFIDVVKRRLELAIEYLASNAAARQEYILENGARVVLPSGELGNFLNTLYSLLFGKRTNVARVLESLAGRDVRKALEMFVSIVTSGHLSTNAITSNVRGDGDFPITEFQIIKILMRTDYRFFSDISGYISNIFYYDNDWLCPDNFLLIEILYFLSINRKRTGEIGLEGYFAVHRVCGEIQKLGYDRGDILQATNYLLTRQLISADHFNFVQAGMDDCVKIQASGFIHLRILCERIEYLYGVIPVVPIADERIALSLSDYLRRESDRDMRRENERDIGAGDKTRAVEVLHKFLQKELVRLREKNPFFNPKASGAVYVLNAMDRAILRYYKLEGNIPQAPNELDVG
jgi:hypothetical protein